MSDIQTVGINIPVVQISTDLTATFTNPLAITCIQSMTINNGQQVYNYASFCTPSAMRAVPTPATNSIDMQLVLQKESLLPLSTAPAGSAANIGLHGLSAGQRKVQFKVFLDGMNSGGIIYSGVGFIVGLAPTTAIEAPVVQSPLNIAVDGELTLSVGA